MTGDPAPLPVRDSKLSIVVPSTGLTYGEMAIPEITEVYQRHALPPLVPSVPQAKVIELSERSGS